MQPGNVGTEEYTIERDIYDKLETLPSKLRMALAFAPYNLTVGAIAERVAKLRGAGVPDTEIEEIILPRLDAMIASVTADEVLKNYGPDHPQARKP